MAVSPESPASFATASMEVFVLGWVCEAGQCRDVTVEMHAHVFDDGSWVQAFNDPDDPLAGCHFSGEDAATGNRLLDVWRALTLVKVAR